MLRWPAPWRLRGDPGGLIHFFGGREVELASGVHFLPIAISAGLASVAAVALTVVGARRGDGRSVIVGTAFSTMAAMLAVHGLTTPGMLVEEQRRGRLLGRRDAADRRRGPRARRRPGAARPRAIRLLLVSEAVLLVTIVGLGAVGTSFGARPVPCRSDSPAAIVTARGGARLLRRGSRCARRAPTS